MINYIFSLIVGLLGSPDYETREWAENVLTKTWLLSNSAVLQACMSPSPEVSLRARSIINRSQRTPTNVKFLIIKRLLNLPLSEWKFYGWLFSVQPDLITWDLVDYAAADDTHNRMFALWLILAPFPDKDSLPYLPNDLYSFYDSERNIQKALAELVDHGWKEFDRIDLGDYQDVNEIRFWARGLPSTRNVWDYNVIMDMWSARKNKEYLVDLKFPFVLGEK